MNDAVTHVAVNDTPLIVAVSVPLLTLPAPQPELLEELLPLGLVELPQPASAIETVNTADARNNNDMTPPLDALLGANPITRRLRP